jgi:hypothetical protein
VLMRKPGQLIGEMGCWAFIVFQILIAGLLLSALSHPIIVGFLAYLTWLMLDDRPPTDSWLIFGLFTCDIVNIFGSYLVFVSLGRNRMNTRETQAVGWRWIFVPIYWLAMSLAAWKAVLELQTNPFSWNKTPHVPVSDRGES